MRNLLSKLPDIASTNKKLEGASSIPKFRSRWLSTILLTVFGTNVLGSSVLATSKHTDNSASQSQSSEATQEEKELEEYFKHFNGFESGEVSTGTPWDFVLNKYYTETGNYEVIAKDAASLAQQIEKEYFDYLARIAEAAAQNANKDNEKLNQIIYNLFDDRCSAENGGIANSFEVFCNEHPEIAKHLKNLDKQTFSKLADKIDTIFLRTANVALQKVLDQYKTGKRKGVLRDNNDRDETTIYVVSAACVALKLAPAEEDIRDFLFHPSTGDRPSKEMQIAAEKLGQADGYWGQEAIKALLAKVNEACQKLDQQEKNKQKAAETFSKPAKNFKQPPASPKPSSKPAGKHPKGTRR